MEFVKPYNWQIFLTIIIGVIKFAIPLFIPILIKIVVDDIIGGDMATDEKIQQLVYWLGGTALVFLIVRPPIEYYRQYLAQLVSNKILYDIRQKLYIHLQKLSLKYYFCFCKVQKIAFKLFLVLFNPQNLAFFFGSDDVLSKFSVS